MSKTVADIAVTVGADVSGLQAGMNRAGKSLDKFDSRAARMGAKFAKIGIGVAAAGVGMAAGLARAASNASRAAKEIQNLSRLSGVGVVEFQKLAAAGESVGFSGEKMADIFKDVNDKFGDFVANGAGPLKDFFQNIAPQVGVTADQFARLSGPDALQLYVSSLEKAGVSQQQMTFYMEALANDATALVPLLQNGGRAMADLGDAAQRSGRIMSRDMVEGGARLDRKLAELSSTISTKAKRAVLEYSDEIISMANWVTDTAIPALASLGAAFGNIAERIQPAIAAVSELIAKISELMSSPGAQVLGLQGESARSDLASDAHAAGWRKLNPKTLLRSGQSLPTLPSDVFNRASSEVVSSDPPGGGGGGGGGGLGRGDFEAMQQQLMSQAEAVDLWRQEQLEKLREFREAKLATEAEYNDAEKRINQEHADAKAQIEQDALQAKLSAASGALGDLSALMQTESSKMFKVGKAAALAQAIVDGYSAATSAWKHGMMVGGPPAAAGFAAMSVAKTAGLISSIRSASPSGGGASAAAGGGASGVPAISRNTTIELIGESFSRDSVVGFIQQYNEDIENGAAPRIVGA